jgi:predicted DNA-binding protein with PD1-like motif
MKYSEAQSGRVFIIRLEDGDVVHEVIEQFAKENNVHAASLIAVGGADDGSRLVVGPKTARALPVTPMETSLDGVHEVCGTGTLFLDENESPILHMHLACGRNTSSRVGCIRRGVKVWHVLEIIMYEICGTEARRVKDEATGFVLLSP